MSEQEKEGTAREAETDPDVEAHRKWGTDEAESKEGEAGGRGEGDEPEVEGHRIVGR